RGCRPSASFLVLLLDGLDAAEADAVALVVFGLVVAIGAAVLLGGVGEGAAADDAVLLVLLLERRAVGGDVFQGVVPGVGAPLADVAVDVVQAPGVGLLLADGRVVAWRVLVVPGVFAYVLDFAERVSGLGAGAAGILPLGLAGQADDLLVAEEL